MIDAFDSTLDVSRTISSDSLVYPGDPPLGVSKFCEIEPGCPCNISQVAWTTHFLTHVDPPLHFVPDGASLDEIPLHRFVGNAMVIEVSGDAVLAEHIPPADIIRGWNLLFKTRNSLSVESKTFDQNHVYVSDEAAAAAAQRGVNLVGIDYLSVDRFGDENYPAHRTLLQNDVLILEGLDLSSAKAGNYILIALPLKIAKGDGSPVRAILIPSQ